MVNVEQGCHDEPPKRSGQPMRLGGWPRTRRAAPRSRQRGARGDAERDPAGWHPAPSPASGPCSCCVRRYDRGASLARGTSAERPLAAVRPNRDRPGKNPPKKVLLVIGSCLRSIGMEAHAADPRRRAPVVKGSMRRSKRRSCGRPCAPSAASRATEGTP